MKNSFDIDCVLACQGPSNDDIGVAKGTVLQEIWRVAGFKNGDFVHRNGVELA